MQPNVIPDVKNLSDRRLWDILQQAESRDARIAFSLAAHARGELAARAQSAEARRFHAPR